MSSYWNPSRNLVHGRHSEGLLHIQIFKRTFLCRRNSAVNYYLEFSLVESLLFINILYLSFFYCRFCIHSEYLLWESCKLKVFSRSAPYKMPSLRFSVNCFFFFVWRSSRHQSRPIAVRGRERHLSVTSSLLMCG